MSTKKTFLVCFTGKSGKLEYYLDEWSGNMVIAYDNCEVEHKIKGTKKIKLIADVTRAIKKK